MTENERSQKLLCFIATFSLLINTLLAPMSALAQSTDEISGTTSEVETEKTNTTEETEESTDTSIKNTTETQTDNDGVMDKTINKDVANEIPTTNDSSTSEAIENLSEKTSVETQHVSDPSAEIIPETLMSISKSSDWTFEKVELYKEYQASGVTLTFTKLPNPSGNIKIEEITLNEKQIEESGALSNKAYDITSDMPDGSFSYNLILPFPETANDKDIEIKYSEDGKDFFTSGGVSTTTNEILVSNLDHFTIFVISSPSSSNVSGIGGGWIDKSNIYSSDNARARTELTLGEVSKNLIATNFGISIPLDAKISGVEVLIEKSVNTPLLNASKDNTVRLVVDGNIVGDNKASSIYFNNTSDSVFAYGSSSDMWGVSITPAQVNSGNFGIVYVAERHPSGVNPQRVRIDQIQIKVYYNTPPNIPSLVFPNNGSHIKPTVAILDWSNVVDTDGDTVTYKYKSSWSGGNYGPVSVGTNTQIDARGSADRTYYWQVQACDSDSCSDWSGPWEVTIDSTIPSTPTGIAIYKGHTSNAGNLIPPNGYTNNTQIRISWNANPDTDLDYYWLGTKSNPHHKKVYGIYYDANMTPGNNPYYYTVSAVDKAGNESPITTSYQIILDTEAPEKPTGLTRFTPDGSKEYVCGSTVQRQTLIPTWNTSTELDFDHYEYTSFNPNGSIGINEQVLYTNEFRHSWIPTTDGTNGYVVRSVDKAGNPSDWALLNKSLSGSCQITYDSTPPAIPTLVSPANNAIVSGNPTQSWNSVIGAHHYIYTSYSDYGGNNEIYTTTVNGTNRTVGGTQTITFYWRVRAVDNVGNESGWSEMRRLTVDNTTPTITNMSIDKSFVKSGDLITITSDVTDFSGVSAVSADFSYNTSYTSRPNPTSTSMTKVVDNTYRAIYTVPSSWNEGTMYIKVAARDNTGGNWIRSASTESVNVDNTAPTGSWIAPTNGSTVSGIVPLQFSATDSASGVQSVNYKYKAVGEADFRTDGNIAGDSWDTTSLELGDYILQATVTDGAGNTADFDITVGVSAIVSSQSAVSTSYSEATITWTTDKPTTSRVVYDTVGHDLGTEPNYGYAFSTTEDTNKVTSHSVTLTGLTAGVTYFYRVISHGSPVTVGGEGTFNVLSVAGAPAPSGNASGAVLGITAPLSSWPKLAYLETTEGDESDVLGAETDITATQGGSFSPTTDDQKVGVIKWVLTHKKISLGVVILLILLIYLLSKRKNKI